MTQRVMFRRRFLLVGATCTLASCGRKGELRLPKAEKQAVPPVEEPPIGEAPVDGVPAGEQPTIESDEKK